MGEAKFTPGPWVAVYRGDNGCGPEGDVHQKSKWDVDPFDSGFMRGEYKWHDACLIAAAPDLYEVLERLVNVSAEIAPEIQDANVFADARSALAKARGETT